MRSPTRRSATGESRLTPHLHALVAEAQWERGGTVVHLPPPSDDDVTAILARVLRQAKQDFAEADAAWPEDEYETGQLQCLQRPLGLALLAAVDAG